MNKHKTLEHIIIITFPVLSGIIYILMIAVSFDTFRLDLYIAGYTILLSMPLFSFILMLTRRPHTAAIISGAVAFFLFYIDQYVFSTRLTHIRFSDFNLIGQAMRVVDRYHLTWNPEITRRLVLFLALSAFLIFLYHYYKPKLHKKHMFIMGLCIFAASSIAIASGVIPDGEQEGFNFTANAENRGLPYSWYCQAKSGVLKAPKSYTPETAKAVLNRYPPKEASDDVRIIAIMNESLADYSLVGNPCFDDPLPFIHSLKEKCFEGKLAVSVFGGGTANTEFEFLTGCSTAFLPEGCTPYLQYVNHSMENLAADFGDRRKVAIHPYYSEEWNRTQVYRFFGFDQFISGVDFGSALETHGKHATSRVVDNRISFGEGPLYVRGLISDQTCFERILEENAGFTFAVTMQNHGDYAYTGDDFTSNTYVTAADRREWTGKPNMSSILYGVNSSSIEQEVHDVNQYLTLSNLSDQAFACLLGELEKSDQKTIVLMFGDHQPGLMIPEHYVDCEESPDLDYIVPYILWANYDIEFDAPEYTSPNYLSAILKKNAGLPLTAWDQFRLDVMQEYPVVTANYIMDKDGNRVVREKLKDYEIVQYMRMFE